MKPILLILLALYFMGCADSPKSAVSDLYGLPFTQSMGQLTRVPLDKVDQVPPNVARLAKTPSGGRFIYNTNSSYVDIHMSHGTYSVYIDGVLLGGLRTASEHIELEPNTYKEITIYLRHDGPMSIDSIELEPGSDQLPIESLDAELPIVYYGSSITQAGLATEPGMTFPAQISRLNHIDFVNLGMSGNGLGEPILAEIMASIDSSLYVVDFWANPKPELYVQRLEPFIRTLRNLRPNTPILITTPFYTPGREAEHEAKLATIEQVMALNIPGVYLHDQTQLAPTMPDNRHPNDQGLTLLAEPLAQTINNIIGE